VVDADRSAGSDARRTVEGDSNRCGLDHREVVRPVADRHRLAGPNTPRRRRRAQNLRLGLPGDERGKKPAGQNAVPDLDVIGHVLIHSQGIADLGRKGPESAGNDEAMGTESAHGRDERPRPRHEADCLASFEIARFRQALEEGHPFGERGREIDLAGDRAGGDGSNLVAQSGDRRDLVDDFVFDQGRIHVAGEKALPAAGPFLGGHVDGRLSDDPPSGRFGLGFRQTLEGKIAGDPGRERVRGTDRGARRFERRAHRRDDAIVKRGTSGICDERQNALHDGQAMLKPAVIIAGPTASGKSGCALAVATEFNGTIVNADAMQLYKELSILTDRPGSADLARAPHRLYGVLSASDPCSAGRWRTMALQELATASSEGRLPIVVGGTGLYLKALTSGLAPVPPVPPSVRAETRMLFERLGEEEFRAELKRRDPEMEVMPRDTQRLLRAFEVLAATGKPLRAWQRKTQGEGGAPFHYACIVFDPPREALYAAIEDRFERMVERGALEEVRRLIDLDPSLPAMKAVGLKELSAYLRGETDLPEAVRQAKQASRNYAKRQVTWFRHQLPDALRVPAQFSESLSQKIFSFIRQFLLTPAG